MYAKNLKIQNKNFTSIISLKLCSNKMSKKNFKNCKIHRIFYKFIHQMKAVFRTIICIFSPGKQQLTNPRIKSVDNSFFF